MKISLQPTGCSKKCKQISFLNLCLYTFKKVPEIEPNTLFPNDESALHLDKMNAFVVIGFHVKPVHDFTGLFHCSIHLHPGIIELI